MKCQCSQRYYLKNEQRNIKNVQGFPEGPSSQFKQRYLFAKMQLFETGHSINLEWFVFFCHTPWERFVDGVDSTIKRTVWKHIVWKRWHKKAVSNTSLPNTRKTVLLYNNPLSNIVTCLMMTWIMLKWSWKCKTETTLYRVPLDI